MFFFIGISIGLYAHDTLIHFGSQWKYYDLGMEPPDQVDLHWSDSAFTDTGWSIGPAQLGYGDGDEATVLDPVFTAYFRHQFNITDTSLFSAFKLDLLYDDGAIVYLNGVEIWRINMAAGLVGYDSFAISSSGDNAVKSLTIPTTALIEGQNTIAVEVHQRSATSSDISFDLLFDGILAGVVDLTRGPYLQKGTQEGMVIKWRTSIAAGSIVRYGLSPDNLDFEYVDTLNQYLDHEVELSDLSPYTTYYYEIASNQGILFAADTTNYFRTSPIPGSNTLFRAWILGDPGTANQNARNVRNAYYQYVGNKHTDMILFLGDNAYGDGTDEEYQYAVFEDMYEDKLRNTVSWSTLGNHDGHSASSALQSGPYYDIFTFPTQAEAGGIASGTEAYYSFDYGNAHFIVLDSYESDRAINGPMYNWCLNDIQNTSAEWIIAFWHHPAYSMGSHNSDTEGRMVDMREQFLPMLEENGVDLVLSGHSHSYERSYFIHGHYDISDSFNVDQHTVGINGHGDGRINGDGAYANPVCSNPGAVYVTAGSSGKISNGPLDHEAMFTSMMKLGSCVMEIEGTTLKLKFIEANQSIQDSFTITKSHCYETKAVCSSISNSYADVEESSDGSIYHNSSDLELVHDPSRGNQTIGLIFEDLKIPRGAWIKKACIQFTSDPDVNVPGQACDLNIAGQAMPDASMFDGTSYEVSTRPQTQAIVSWNLAEWIDSFQSSTAQRTPDLSWIIQEIVNQSGYDSLSNIGFVINGSGRRAAISYDHISNNTEPSLCVEYSFCPKTQYLTNEDILIDSYSAQHKIISSTQITQTNQQYSSGNSIELLPHFEVTLGSLFNATILGCKRHP